MKLSTPPLYTVKMFFFGHAGITLGAAVLTTGGVETWHHRYAKSPIVAWTLALSRYVDIRLLLIGSLLPDIIDKPVGEILLRSTINNGRIFGHTLLFAVILLCLGTWLYRHRRRTWLLTLGTGAIAHLVMDEMWLAPRTLFWPLFGWDFPTGTESNIIKVWLNSLVHTPSAYIPEILGAIIVTVFIAILIYRKKMIGFIRHGTLN